LYQICPEHIFNATNNGKIIIDTEGTILSTNEKAFAILGIKKQEMRGESISKSLPEIGKIATDALKNKDDILGQQITEKGISIILNISTIKEKDLFLGIVVSFQQTILFEQAAKKLEFYKSQNKELNAIFQSVSDALWVCDGQGYVVNINKASEKLNKIRKQDVIGKKVDELIQRGMFDKSVTTQVLKKKKQVTIVQNVKKTKNKILATGTPVFNESGEISLVVINSRDLTSLNIIKEKLEKSLEESDRLRNVLQEMNLQEMKKQDVVGESEAIQSVLKIALKLSHMEVSNILLLGESGTGKGLMAKFIHKNSRRKNKIFMQINCAALPDNLLEAELFGYEKGAFTGARSNGKPGLIELSENGTLFLDEIGEIPLVLQSKLLKYFDDQKVMRVGGIKPRKIDCTIIAATNRNLESRVKQKRFRQDLFYRINTFTITMPPLRERPEDIFDIVNHYLDKYNKQFQAQKKISFEAFSMIQKYNFPGNVRELKNIIKKGVVLSDSRYLDEHLLKDFRLTTEIIKPFNPEEVNVFNFKNAMMAYEKDILLHMLKICRTTREIAKKMEIDHSTVVRKLKKYSLSTSGA
jgi:PAS domain S-box-containing protein